MKIEALTPKSALPKRVWGYLLQRFPPLAYTILVGLFAGSAFGLAERLGGGATGLATEVSAALVVLLVFLHLRIMDEHKDFDVDCEAYPERLLSRRVVTLPLLRNLGLVAVALELLLVLSISQSAVLAWLACLVFTLLMRVEFGVGQWLNRHLVIYAVTHNPIVGLLAGFLWVCAEAPLGIELWLYIAIVSVGSLAFEIGRKIRLEHEEVSGVESYSSVLGKRAADRLLIGLRLLTGAGLFLLMTMLGSPQLGGVALGLQVVAGGWLWPGTRGAKGTEGVATATLLLDFLLIWVLVW